MRAVVSPGQVLGSVSAPPSKSYFQRACAAALLHRGETDITFLGKSEDDLAALRIMQDLGAKVYRFHDDFLRITSHGVSPVRGSIHCGESGLAARLFTPIAALSSTRIRINGEGSLRKRPMREFGTLLPSLGVKLSGFKGTLPFSVQGPLEGNSVEVDGSISSQFASGLLFALSDAATRAVTLTIRNATSLPYLRMTQAVLEKMGRPVAEVEQDVYCIDPSRFRYEQRISITTEHDWSSAAPFLVAGCTAGEVGVGGIRRSSLQADVEIVDVLQKAKAKISWKDEDYLRVRSSELTAFEHDCTHAPDLVPILAVLASACKGESRIGGLHRLTHKESNRTETTTELLSRAQIPYRIEADTLIVEGSRIPKSCTINSHNDHRIVMAATILALRADGPVVIENADAVRKSYPDFFRDLQSIRARIVLK